MSGTIWHGSHLSFYDPDLNPLGLVLDPNPNKLYVQTAYIRTLEVDYIQVRDSTIFGTSNKLEFSSNIV